MEEETKKEETQEEEIKAEAAEEPVKAEDAKKDESQDEKPLDKMTAPELKEIAKLIPGVTGVTAMKKEDLIKLIKEFRGIVDEEPKKEAAKAALDLKGIKEKIASLKAEKKSSKEEKKNRKEINVLRRRINRLKKRARKAG